MNDQRERGGEGGGGDRKGFGRKKSIPSDSRGEKYRNERRTMRSVNECKRMIRERELIFTQLGLLIA